MSLLPLYAATVGCLLVGALVYALTRAFKSKPHPYTWNRPEVLPPVGCPLVINISGVPFRAERLTYLRERCGEMDYRLSTGEVIAGRYPWSYP